MSVQAPTPSQPYEGATPEQLRHPMVRELLGVHDMFRREMSKMLRFVDDLMAGDQQLTSEETTMRVRSLIRAGQQYTQILHSHHHLETSMMFPALAEAGLETDVIDRLNADHDDIAALIDQFEAGVRDYANLEPAVIESDLQKLSDALRAHLAYEETHTCPFLARMTRWPI